MGNKYFGGILPMDRINKPVLNSLIGPLCVFWLIGFVVLNLIRIRLMSETHLTFMSLSLQN